MRRRTWVGLAVVASFAVAAVLDPRPTYLARVAVHQVALHLSRTPLDAYAPATERARQNLARVPAIAGFARERIHLATAGQYTSVAAERGEPLWNLSACPALSLRPATFWFPITGRVPYLGFFDRAAAERWADRYRRDGMDVWIRPAGTYSTLGWWDDPLLPAMLDWPERRLAETLIHEWVHATVWIPGEVGFDESLASFVGERAAHAWLVERYGPGSASVRQAELQAADRDLYHHTLGQLAAELEVVYAQPVDDAQKRAVKEALFGSLPVRLASAGFRSAEWTEGDARGWNNARLSQFRTYHRGYDAFERLLAAEGSLGALVDEVRGWPPGDPWATLAARAGSVSNF